MSDYNDYLLPEPCLRLDSGFGEQYQSIELGDGTGYLRLRGSEDRETELRDRIASLNAENVDIDVENSKLRELVRDMYDCIRNANEQDWFYFERDKLGCGMSCTVNGESCGLCALADRMRELGVGVDQ